MSPWPHQPIISLGTIITGSTPKTSEEHFYGGDIPFVTPAELDQTDPIMNAARTLSETGSQESRLLPEGTVMVCCIGSLGKVGIAGRTVASNQQINSVIFDPKIIWPRFGFYACRLLKSRLEVLAPATTVPIVNKSKFGQLEIPVPPLPEQKRIADILDRAEALRAKRRVALEHLDELTQAIFIDMFGDSVSNPMGWKRYPLKHCVNHIQIGPFGSLLHKEDYVFGGIPLINPTHIENGKIVPDVNQSITVQKLAELQLYQLQQGDVIMGRRGEMGRCAIVGSEHNGTLCGTGSLFIRPDESKAIAMYLQATLSSESMRKHLEGFSLGATLPNLNRGIVGELAISLPPIELQKEFSHHIESIEKLKTTYKSSLTEIDELFLSLQYRAFRGEL
ncbi:TPA: restriction endonuclease subunit S [Methanosarcina acetivorans]|uniref:Type I restriction modification enzyme protein S n=2 Tax=Methanosarcina acetivorans TaxID=2214 RepID=Q8TN78_METAC|nr:restriction endonuclease subunit S [Methanosarcina acetivorans]AAM05801.1 type I restriction modification enzyme protein S [Methanosarcina acetivorans C2A]HIH92707.1 restriction endonuclease subunit S [Methanosarcina acetivorans]